VPRRRSKGDEKRLYVIAQLRFHEPRNLRSVSTTTREVFRDLKDILPTTNRCSSSGNGIPSEQYRFKKVPPVAGVRDHQAWQERRSAVVLMAAGRSSSVNNVRRRRRTPMMADTTINLSDLPRRRRNVSGLSLRSEHCVLPSNSQMYGVACRS
jgi:hypothetical protein